MILNLLIPKEKIIGIEISNQKLRMLNLEMSKSKKTIVKGKSELELDENLFKDEGVDEKVLSAAIAKLKDDFKPKKYFSPYAVITVPQIGVYSEIMQLPKTLNENQLTEAITLNASENLPLPLSKCYMDWQIIDADNNYNKILISIISKNIADSYIKALKNNGIKLIALETLFLSIERIVHIPAHPTIFLYLTNDGLTSIIYKNKIPYFSQFESWKEIIPGKEIRDIRDLNKTIKSKIKKLKLYFDSKNKEFKIENVFLMSHGFDSDIIINKIGKTDIPIIKAKLLLTSLKSNDWVPVAGAATRALIPRSEDGIISLLPIGTESLYETQKATSFAKSILFLLTTLSFFYITIFTSAFFVVSTLQYGIDNQMNQKNNIPIPQEYAKIKTETEIFNSYLKDLDKISSTNSINYESVLRNMNQINTPGINLSTINLDKTKKIVTISGISKNRESLNIFKSKLNNSSDFRNINLILNDLAKKDNIAFKVSLEIK
ncbi:pilus assembly protein PilM [Patescibacteria group bacterium]|nr:pilus assembly protein PilM [Patescibacteria group bacterium]